MSKRINLNNINAGTLSVLSDFNIAYKKQCEYSKQRRENIKKINEELKAYKDANKAKCTRKDGTMTAEYTQAMSDFEARIGKVEAWYEDVTEPLKEAQKPALSLVDKDLYYAYAAYMKDGNPNARCTLTLSDKNGKVTGTYTVTKSYSTQMREFLEKLGLDATNDTAFKKCLETMKAWCGGVQQDNNGNYVKNRTMTNFNRIVILAFLKYAIVARRSFVVKADNSLAINKGIQEVAA